MQSNYDFSKGKRGKYARQYTTGTNLIILAPDVAKVYKDADTVNETLRAIAKIKIAIHKKGQPA